MATAKHPSGRRKVVLRQTCEQLLDRTDTEGSLGDEHLCGVLHLRLRLNVLRTYVTNSEIVHNHHFFTTKKPNRKTLVICFCDLGTKVQKDTSVFGEKWDTQFLPKSV